MAKRTNYPSPPESLVLAVRAVHTEAMDRGWYKINKTDATGFRCCKGVDQPMKVIMAGKTKFLWGQCAYCQNFIYSGPHE